MKRRSFLGLLIGGAGVVSFGKFLPKPPVNALIADNSSFTGTFHIKKKPLSTNTLNGLFKEVYGNDIKNLIPDGSVLLKYARR